MTPSDTRCPPDTARTVRRAQPTAQTAYRLTGTPPPGEIRAQDLDWAANYHTADLTDLFGRIAHLLNRGYECTVQPIEFQFFVPPVQDPTAHPEENGSP